MNPSNTLPKIGDRVRIARSNSPLRDRLIDKLGAVGWAEIGWCWVVLDEPIPFMVRPGEITGCWALADELEVIA